MRAVVLILLLISASKANYTVRCSNSTETSLTFEPTDDNVAGRYKVEWCSQAEKDVTEWKLVLRYLELREPSKCQNYAVGFPKGLPHSRFELPLSINLNCTQVCLSEFLDLVFNNTCYHISTQLQKNNSWRSSYDSLHYIINNITKANFINSKPEVSTQTYDAGWVVLNWYLGLVPATDYFVNIWDNEMKLYNASCRVKGLFLSEVSCSAELPPLCYTAILVHRAPWIEAHSLFGQLANIEYNFCLPKPADANASSSPTGAWRVFVGVAVVVVLMVLVLCAVRKHFSAAWHRRVQDHWLKSTQSEPTEPPSVGGAILLLYARDCAQFVRAAERLGALVQHATRCQVIDVYTGESTRLWAPAGDEWMRLLMARDDTRVLVLQSPAGALLAAELAESRAGPTLAAPLLGSRAVWRRPHAGDALLSLSLRLLSAAPPPAPYRRHYVACISGLGADMAGGVTPLRRYTLPDTVLHLLRDLVPALDLEKVDLEPQLLQFKEAAENFANHVREYPDYLAEELLFI